MGLWQGRPGRECSDARGERAGMGRKDGRKREKAKEKKSCFFYPEI